MIDYIYGYKLFNFFSSLILNSVYVDESISAVTFRDIIKLCKDVTYG